MYVVGNANTTRRPHRRASATNALSRPALNFSPARFTSNATASAPTLCRVRAYSLPGFPNPTTKASITPRSCPDHARVRSLARVVGGCSAVAFGFALFAGGSGRLDLSGGRQHGDDGHLRIAERRDALRHGDVGQPDHRVGLHVGDVD